MPPEEPQQHRDEPLQRHRDRRDEYVPNEGTSGFELPTNSPSIRAQQHNDNNMMAEAYDDNDDDDDSFHDLEAVLALVAAAASEGNNTENGMPSLERNSGNQDAQSTNVTSPPPTEVIVNPFDAHIIDLREENGAFPAEPESRRSTSFVCESDAADQPTMIMSSESHATSEEESKEEIDQEMERIEIPRNFASIYNGTEEAAVLGLATSLSLQYEDARLAEAAAEEEELLLALKRSLYEGGGRATNTASNVSFYNPNSNHQEATIVEITDEQFVGAYVGDDATAQNFRAQNGAATAHAEWIGQDYSNINASSASNSNRSRNHNTAAAITLQNTDGGAYDDNNTQEATVIDSAPLEKNQEGFTEEAQVLLEEERSEENEEDIEDSKPAARETERAAIVGEEEAEVLGIQERGRDIHPIEFASVDTEDAELVRTDDSYTVAVPSTSSQVAERAPVTIGDMEDEMSHHSPAAPQAMAVVASASRPLDATTLTTASAINEDAQQLLDATAPVEQALVLETGGSDAACANRKQASVGDDYHRANDNNCGSSTSQFSGLDTERAAEREGEVLSIQEDRDLHPVTRAENRLSDFEAEFVGSNPEDSAHLALSYHSNFPSVIDAEPAETQPAATPAILDQQTMFQQQERHTVSAAGSLAAAECSASANLPIAASHRSGEAQVISIQTAEFPAFRGSGVDAELVGELEAAATLFPSSIAHDSRNNIFTEPSLMAEVAIRPYSGELSSSSHPQATATWVEGAMAPAPVPSERVVQSASVFVDPHQPNAPPVVRRRESDIDLRAAIAAIDSMELQQHQLQHTCVASGVSATIPSTTGDGGSTEPNHAIDEYSLNWLMIANPEATPSQQRIGTGTNDTSYASSPNGSTRSAIQTVGRSTAAGIQQLSSSIAKSTSTVMDSLFGDVLSPCGKLEPLDEILAQAIFSRTLLPWSVIHNPTTGMWIATLQTNQKALDKKNVVAASKSLRAFSMPSEKQAVCLAKAWTPPRMLPLENQKNCHICKAKFAMFRRPCHCRNCGVCVCKDCTVAWPSKMVPETYLNKTSNLVHVCRSCDWLSISFRVALLEGDLDRSVAIHGLGNVNLHTPFCNVKGELFYPVHCAVLGGNIQCLKFLVDIHCCPIKSVRVSSNGNSSKFTPIVTSKGRSLLGIAMEKENIEMIRYLVLQKGAILSGEMDITPDMLARNLENVLRMIPEDAVLSGAHSLASPLHTTREHSSRRSATLPESRGGVDGVVPLPPGQQAFNDNGNERTLSEEARDFGAIRSHGGRQGSCDVVAEEHNDDCIICFDRPIDSIATPCGHQCCCQHCSENLNSRCPVCSSQCSFIRVYKP